MAKNGFNLKVKQNYVKVFIFASFSNFVPQKNTRCGLCMGHFIPVQNNLCCFMPFKGSLEVSLYPLVFCLMGKMTQTAYQAIFEFLDKSKKTSSIYSNWLRNFDNFNFKKIRKTQKILTVFFIFHKIGREKFKCKIFRKKTYFMG